MILYDRHYTVITFDGQKYRGNAESIQIPEPITDGPLIITDHGNIEYHMPGDVRRIITNDLEEAEEE
ncbi:MAG: hypothetical protein LKJ69_01650 [Lactobacillus sp.]|jgi:hypothetical protein|nr:hypothetical protein [Lactobacillus sp.]MCI2032088.1 hypothetical protein [Lactobacillus sp.]